MWTGGGATPRELCCGTAGDEPRAQRSGSAGFEWERARALLAFIVAAWYASCTDTAAAMADAPKAGSSPTSAPATQNQHQTAEAGHVAEGSADGGSRAGPCHYSPHTELGRNCLVLYREGACSYVVWIRVY